MSRIKHVIGYGATAAVALGIGIGAGSAGGSSTAVAASKPAPTVTVTVPAQPADTVTKTVTAPPVTKKVTAPPVTKTVTVKAKPKGPSATIPGDGTFAVGTDIQPGTYVSSAAPGGIGECYWARLRDMNDGMNSIIANNLSAGQSIVTIAGSDKFFKTQGCNTWKRR